jgi:hypothetical protein
MMAAFCIAIAGASSPFLSIVYGTTKGGGGSCIKGLFI